MKRLNTAPDLLASMTADALFAGERQPAEPIDTEQGLVASPGRWFKRLSGGGAASRGLPAPGPTLDDDWVGGWYARARLRQAETLARLAGRNDAGADRAFRDVEGGEAEDLVDAVIQRKDFS
jgi:hypothetical protein